MSLLRSCKEDKLSAIALHALGKDMTAGLGLNLEGTLSGICQAAQVNRTQVYERKRQMAKILDTVDLPEPGRPGLCQARDLQQAEDAQGLRLTVKVLEYRLAHPGAVVSHKGGATGYSDGFKRFVLDLLDQRQGSPEDFCRNARIAYNSFRDWQAQDRLEPFSAKPPKADFPLPPFFEENRLCQLIVEDYAAWQGSLRDFFAWEAPRLRLPPNQIRRVLTIAGALPVKKSQAPRYRGSTEPVQPGQLLVTDGKTVEVVSERSGEIFEYNWQAMVDQATSTHTACVVTQSETAQAVKQAFDDSCAFLSRSPLGLIHDQKSIHQEAQLKEHVEATTLMIPATENRPQNKACVEGEFGRFEQQVGSILLDDSTSETLRQSAVREVLRAYTAAVNHAGRAEFDGKSRVQTLRDACPDTDKDRAFIQKLHSAHTQPCSPEPLPSAPVARQILDEGFTQFQILQLDPNGSLRRWLSLSFSVVAIVQALAIFGAKHLKGLLKSKTAHRYLVKLIQNQQSELDLREQERLLLDFFDMARKSWLAHLERQYQDILTQCAGACASDYDLPFKLAELALSSSIMIQRPFFEDKLKQCLLQRPQAFDSTRNHIRRMFEINENDRFQLISQLTAWQSLAQPI